MDENTIKSIKNINILIGEMDKLVSEKKIDEMLSMFGSAHLKKMEGVAHFPFFEDPKVLNKALEEVLVLISNSNSYHSRLRASHSLITEVIIKA